MGMIIQSAESYAKGTEFTFAYEKKSNSYFLRFYGLAYDDNDEDYINFSIYIKPRKFPLTTLKYLAYPDLVKMKYDFVVKKFTSKEPEEIFKFIFFMRLAVSNNVADISQIRKRLQIDLKNKIYVKFFNFGVISVENEKAAFMKIIDACRESIKKYPTTLEHDEEVLKTNKMPDGSKLTYNQRNIFYMLKGEKEVIRQLQTFSETVVGLIDNIQAAKDHKSFQVRFL